MAAQEAGVEVTLDELVVSLNDIPNNASISMNDEPKSAEGEIEASCAHSQFCEEGQKGERGTSIECRNNALEMACCVIFFTAGHILIVLLDELMSPQERPIPSQYLDSIREYAKNLMYNEQKNEQTLSTAVILVISLLGPFALQL
jgi:hypothetical protein